MLFCFLIVVTIITASFAYGAISAAPWVPMWQRDTERVLKILKNLMQQNCINKSHVYELGCGDARMLVALSRAGFRGVGFEISILPFMIAVARKFFKRANYTVKYKNFWFASLSPADAVFFFLLPQIMPKLRAKLERELCPGAIVVSYVWPIPGWNPIIVDEVPRQPKIFVYER